MRKALMATVAAGLLLLVLWLAQDSVLLTSLAVAGLALSVLLWWWSRRPEAAASLAAVVATLVLTSELTFQVASRLPGVDPLQLGFGFWMFTGVTAAAAWLAPRHRGNRAVTLAATGAILTAASAGAAVSPAAVPVAGFALAAVVLVWRTRRPRFRPRAYDPGGAAPSEVDRGVPETWRTLQDAREALETTSVQVLGPQRVAGARVEQLLRTPEGLVVVETRRWGGRVRLNDDGVYALDGDPDALTARLAPLVRLVAAVHRAHGGPVSALVVFWDETDLPAQGVTMDVLAGRRSSTRIILARGADLPQRVAPGVAAR